jgi:hypothetical protein
MLKYKLIITGTAEEIGKARNRAYQINEYSDFPLCIQNLEMCTDLTSIEVAFITREPKYRVKTLVELVQEFGEKVGVGYDAGDGQPEILIDGHGMLVGYLGHPFTPPLGEEHECWKKIFLKEIT